MGHDDPDFPALRARKPTNRWIVVVFLVGMVASLLHETHPEWFDRFGESDPPMRERPESEQPVTEGQSLTEPKTPEIDAKATRVTYAELKPVLNTVNVHRKYRACRAAPRIPATAYRAVPKDSPQSGVLEEPGHEVAKAWGLAIIDLSVEQLWMAVNDEEAYPGTLPVTVSTVFRGEPFENGRHVFQKMTLPGPFSDRWWIIRKTAGVDVFEASGGQMWEACAENATNPSLLRGTPLRGELEDAEPVNWTWAGWMLMPLSENLTLVEYFTWTDPGGSLPAGPASRFASGAVKKTMIKIASLARRYGPADLLRGTRPDGAPLVKEPDTLDGGAAVITDAAPD